MREIMTSEVEWSKRKNSIEDGSDAYPVRGRGNVPDLLQDVVSNGYHPEDTHSDTKRDTQTDSTDGGRLQGGSGGGKGKRDTKQPADTSEEESSGYSESNVTSGNNSCDGETQRRPRERRKGRLENLKRALCCLGWLLCCPCWTLGFCLREQPETMEELRGDPCWPCDENAPSPSLRD